MAAIAPTPTGAASCMYRPRFLTSVTASDSVKALAATRAEYSPETVPGHIIGLDTGAAQNFPEGDTRGQDRGLRIFGELERLVRAFETELLDREPECFIGGLKNPTRVVVALECLFPHPGLLRALSGKEERNFTFSTHRSMPSLFLVGHLDSTERNGQDLPALPLGGGGQAQRFEH